MLFVPADLRILPGHGFYALIPVRHADGQPVGFGGGGQGFTRAALRQFKRVAQDPVYAAAGEDRLLNHHLILGPGVHASAERGVFPFGILPHHVEINIAGFFTRQRAGNAGEQAHRTQVDVLIELAAKLEQRAPQ